MMVDEHFKVQLVENYKDFTAPDWVPKAINRLLDGIPDKYLNGLGSVLLSNSEGLDRRRTRQKTLSRKRRVAIKDCRGLYFQKWQGRPARIEVFVDKIIAGWPAVILKIPYGQDVAFGGVIYHELWHHIHKTSSPEYKEREDVAEEWERKLAKLYFPVRYWYLKPLVKMLQPVVWLLKLLRKLVRPKLLPSNT